MRDLNRVQLRGRLGKDPEFKMAGGKPLATMSIATSQRWEKAGEPQERTDWHDLAVWGPSAEWCRDNLRKGALVAVEGVLEYSTYEKGDATVRRAEVKVWDIHEVVSRRRSS